MNDTVEVIDDPTSPEAVTLLGEAFASHPMVPADPPGKPEHWGATLMMGTMLKAFRNAPGATLFGIRRDGELAALAFVHDYPYEPGLPGMVKMLWQTARVVGLRKLPAMLRVLATKHDGDDRRLELLILGTANAHQRQGLARRLMRHVMDHAKREGYAAVTLEAAQNDHAFGFYEREGFVTE